MERRRGLRKSVNLVASLPDKPDCHCKYRVKNISTNGLFVQNCWYSLHEGDFLKLRVFSPYSTTSRYYNIDTFVLHKSVHGIGVIWAEYASDVHEIVTQALGTPTDSFNKDIVA